MERLDALVERVPISNRNAIARVALRMGLEILEADPTKLVEEPRVASPPSQEPGGGGSTRQRKRRR